MGKRVFDVTHAQAVRAVEILLDLAEQAGGPCALHLAYPVTQSILDLAAEIKQNPTNTEKE